MKLILKEYLASLKERDELDKAVLPNLLSEIGLRVLNTPMIGTRQNGVDIAAVGRIVGEDDEEYLYLFCIKGGNVTRKNWNDGVQSVRQELDEIRDLYLHSNVSKEHASLPVKICLCCGGEVEESVRGNWAGYSQDNTTDRISYEEWNGDRLADYMMQSLLAREVLDELPRRNFHKAVAMVNEPSACYDYTRAFLGDLLGKEHASKKDQLLRLRQSYICLHAVTAWAIDAGNLESTYLISELGMLFCWSALGFKEPITSPTKHDQALQAIMYQFIELYIANADRYFSKTAYAHGDKLHALSMAVKSKEPVDVNLSLFDLIGRLAIYGIWANLFSMTVANASPESSEYFREITRRNVQSIIEIINNNPTLNSPIKDDHMIEISLVMYLAQRTRNVNRIIDWVSAISDHTTFSLLNNSQYPTCLQDYADLIAHPIYHEQSYRDEACVGSILYPFIYLWLRTVVSDEDVAVFVDRLESSIPNCTYQAWFPDEETDEVIWSGGTDHGVCVTGLSPKNGHDNVAEILDEAMQSCTEIHEISAIKFGLIPLFLTACRHYRLPVPPNFWFVGG